MESMTSLSRTYVLVHGSFVGAWCWSRVVPELEAAGHEVHAPALTGVRNQLNDTLTRPSGRHCCESTLGV